jgi:UPF0271 protein
MALQIDINCDMGESFGLYTYGHDADMLPLISSANVACGFHAGDPTVMRTTVAGARTNKVKVGAHVGFPDRMGFGRRNMQIAPRELKDHTTYQMGALAAFVRAQGLELQHVKPHGSLYMMALEDQAMAKALVEAVVEFDDTLMIYTIRDSATWQAAQAKGLRPVAEFFADRPYHKTGQVKMFNWTIKEAGEDPNALGERVARLITQGEIPSFEGGTIAMTAETVCVHSDTPGASEILKAVRDALDENHITIAPPQ